jgi:hypothetical protein
LPTGGPLKWSSAGCPTSLATDPVERVVVVMKDGAAREAPLAAILFDQLARVAAGRKAMVVAVLRNEHQQIAIGGSPVSGDRHGDIANHMTKLRARGALRREAAGEGADFVAAADVDDRALEDRVYREAIDHGLDLAIVERAATAREEIVDRCTIFEVAFAHSHLLGQTCPGQAGRPSVGMLRLFHSRVEPSAVAHRVPCRFCPKAGPPEWIFRAAPVVHSRPLLSAANPLKSWLTLCI